MILVHISSSFWFISVLVPVIGSGISFEQSSKQKLLIHILPALIHSFVANLVHLPLVVLFFYDITSQLINLGLHKTPWSKVIKHLMGIIQNESSFPQSMISSQFSIFFLNLFISVRNTFQEVLNFICFENLVPVC